MGTCCSLLNKGADPTIDNRSNAPVKNPHLSNIRNEEPVVISSPFNVNLGFYAYALDYDEKKGIQQAKDALSIDDLKTSNQIIIRPSQVSKVECQLGIKIDATVIDVDTNEHRRKSSDSSSTVTYIYNSDNKEIQKIINEESYCICMLNYNSLTAI